MASDQQFCLRWNNHQSTLVSVFDNLLESQTLVDCTLAADGQYLKAHKVVLSACSPYLEAILCQNLDKHPILILKDVKFSELKAMLDYMYRGEVNISQEQLSTFLKAAESLQIKGLTDSGGGGANNESRERDLLKRQDLRKPLNQPVPHIPQPRPVVPHQGMLEPRRSLPHFPPHIADMQPQSPRHAREGSTSPTARKRRRPNRPSSDDSNFVSTPNSLSENQPDTSDSCDVPVKQSAPSTPSNVPNPSTKAPETDSPRTTPQPQTNSEQKQVVVKKEFPETLLTPKTEFVDYGNDNSMEDVTYEDDEDEEVDLSKPGTSFATNSQGFPPWQMGDGSNDDSNNMYSPDVTAAATQNNSQDCVTIPGSSPLPKLRGSGKENKSLTFIPNRNKARKSVQYTQNVEERDHKKTDNGPVQTTLGKSVALVKKYKRISHGKRIQCSKCNEYVNKRCIRIHSKYYCGIQPDEKEWKLYGSVAFCMQCKKMKEPDAIEFHVKYLCCKKPIWVQCFYCPRLFNDYRGLLKHMNYTHKKKHRYLDLLSILPTADPITAQKTPVKVVKHFFNNVLNVSEEAYSEDVKPSTDLCLQLRQKSNQTCETCGKTLVGTHAYENHINTKCESEDHYSCFFCSFKAEYAFETLDHMEDVHKKQFNTYDLLQAQITGIIPIVESPTDESVPEKIEMNFTNQHLYEPYTVSNVPAKFEKLEEKDCSDTKNAVFNENVEQAHNRKVIGKLKLKDKIRLRVSKKKGKIGNSLITRSRKFKRQKIEKESCDKCNKLVHPNDIRIHKKYHCGKEPLKKEWILQNGRALCLKCKKVNQSYLIDFHVKYLCKKRPVAIQCFYCPEIRKDYRSQIVHMKKAHNRTHYYHDLMTILPTTDSLSHKSCEEGNINTSPKVIKHPFIYKSPIITESNGVLFGNLQNTSKFSTKDDFYTCFYCECKCRAAYEVLDHMEDVHGKEHNLYDMLQSKMAAGCSMSIYKNEHKTNG